MSIRYKTIFGIAIIEAILLSIIIWNALVFLRTLNKEELYKRASITVNLLATTAKDAVISTDIASIDSLLDDVMTNPDIVYVRILASDHTLAYRGDLSQRDKPFSADKELDLVRDGVFDTVAEITEAGVTFGRLEIGFSTYPFEKFFIQAQKKITVIAFIEILLSAFFSFILGTMLVKQLRQLGEASKRIAKGELGFQIKVIGTDEIAATAKTFNMMSAQLKSYLSEIGQKNKTLQHEISHRENAHQALFAEKEQLSVTLRSIGDGVITTDIEGNIVLMNKVAEELTGWSKQEATGAPLEDLFHIIDPKTRQPRENPVQKVLKTGKFVKLLHHFLLLSKNGTERKISESSAPIRDRNNLIIGAVLVFRDESEKMRMEEELFKSEKLEAIGILAGGIAHDFNNILFALLGNINLSQMALPHSNEKIKKYLDDAEKACLRATNLTQQLLTFSKGGTPVKTRASIPSIIKESAEFVLTGSNVRCNYCLDKELWPAELDVGQISQVIQNIVINARQAMPDGGIIDIIASNFMYHPKGTLTLPPGPYIKLVITDYGIGMPKHLLEKVFDPYFTTKQKGNGLGLAITHSIITKHDGLLTLCSEQGIGTTFTIYLPALIENKISEQVHQTNSVHDLEIRSILVMDDEEMILNLIKTFLQNTFCKNIVCARDGEEAIKLYKQAMDAHNPFSICIMDLTVPGGMGGGKAAKRILSMHPEAKLIVSSGYSNDPILTNYRDHGFCAMLTKPFLLKNLIDVITRVFTT